jgi:hypothetical protein
MTLEKLLRLATAAASHDAGFDEHYDFAGEVGPQPVIRLIVQRQLLMEAIEKVLQAQKFRPDSPLALTLRDALDRAKQGWPKDPIDPPPFSL